MARNARSRRRLLSRHLRPAPYHIHSYAWKVGEGSPKKMSPALEKKDWEDAMCSVCMEYPHNAVLLLCSSHDKGCHPYMCGTSYRHSNCLDQFQKAYSNAISPHHPNEPIESSPSFGLSLDSWPTSEKLEGAELSCPLCRGQVKGFTVVEPAREYLNEKRRNCTQDDCSFMGTYKELRKHVRVEHPCAKPRELDPVLEQKWRTLEYERERQDVISTIRSSTPRAVLFGDYVIEMSNSDLDPDDEIDDGDGDFDGEGRSLSRSILYFFLREGFINLNRNRGAPENRDDGFNSFMGDAGGSATYPLEITSDNEDAVDPPISQGRGMSPLRSDGRRRRRRRRSHGRSGYDGS